MNKDAGVVTGLVGALQRIIVNGNAIEDLMDVAKDSRGITKYVGPPCDDNTSKTKCMNGGICTPFFRSYVCKCSSDFIGPKCEKSKLFSLSVLLVRGMVRGPTSQFFFSSKKNYISYLPI